LHPKGLHAAVDLSASGNDEFSHAEAEAGFFDTITNNSFWGRELPDWIPCRRNLNRECRGVLQLNVQASTIGSAGQTQSMR
jgi:hypothetical protein